MGCWIRPFYLSLLLPWVAADFLATPRVLWTHDTHETTTHGNAVTLSDDNGHILVTTEQGHLHILSAQSSGSTTESLRFVPAYDDGERIACLSGAALFPSRQHQQQQQRNQQYSVYAIVELDRGTSNVIAVDTCTAQKVWNIRLDGTVAGSPVVNAMGNRIYVTHNTQDDKGLVSVIAVSHDHQSASVLETLSTATASADDSSTFMAPLTAPTLQTMVPQSSNDDTTQFDMQDVVVFAETNVDSPETGRLYVLVSTPPSSRGGNDTSHGNIWDLTKGETDTSNTSSGSSSQLQLYLASKDPQSAMVRPALSQNGRDVYLGQAGARIMGWYGPSDSDLLAVINGITTNLVPAWERRFDADSDGDISENAIPTTPVLSADESLLFVTTGGSKPYIYALSVGDDGSQAWSSPASSVHLADPVVSVGPNDDERVYFIESATGIIQQFAVDSGDLVWELNACAQDNDDDTCAMEAQFAVTSSANTLYYAYTNGTVVALQVAAFETDAPTEYPSVSPVETSGPPGPSLRGTSAPTSDNGIATSEDTGSNAEASPQSDNTSTSSTKSKGPSLAFILGTVCGGLGLLLVLSMYIFCGRSIRGDKAVKSFRSSRGHARAKDEEAAVASGPSRHQRYQGERTSEILNEQKSNENATTDFGAAPAKSTPKRFVKKRSLVDKHGLALAHLDAIVEALDDDNTPPTTTSPSTASPQRPEDEGVELALDDHNKFRPTYLDARRNLTTNFDEAAMLRAASGATLPCGISVASPPPTICANESFESLARAISPAYISDLISIDSSLYFDDGTIMTEQSTESKGFAATPLIRTDSTLSLAKILSTKSDLSHPADERSECRRSVNGSLSKSVPVPLSSPDIATAVKLERSIGTEDLLPHVSACMERGSGANSLLLPSDKDEAQSVDALDESADFLTKVTTFFASTQLAAASTVSGAADAALETSKLGMPSHLGPRESLSPSQHPQSTTHTSMSSSSDSKVVADVATPSPAKINHSSRRAASNVARSTRPKAGLFSRNQRASQEPQSLEPRMASTQEEMAMTDYLEEREARAVYHPIAHPMTMERQSDFFEKRAPKINTRNGGGRRLSRPDAQDTANDASIMNALSSFMTELAKVEEQFFNPQPNDGTKK